MTDSNDFSPYCRKFWSCYGCITVRHDNNIHKKHTVHFLLGFSGKHGKRLIVVVAMWRPGTMVQCKQNMSEYCICEFFLP